MSLLVAIIYLAFISLGLPDSLLGSGWPVMHIDLGVPLSWAGIISFVVSGSTVVSALLSDRLTRKFGTGVVTAVSVLLTAAAMMGYTLADNFYVICLIAVPYGLGAGAIDACLNNYVALHLSSRQMSWLHCCWGIGATISPYIMSAAIASSMGWKGGYRTVSIIQLVLTFIMFMAIPLWKKYDKVSETGEEESVSLSIKQIFAIPGTKAVFFAFLGYCAMEVIPITWASSYFREVYSLDAEKAAALGSLFYIGMTAGRGINGIFANRMGDRQLIRTGLIVIFAACILIAIPTGTYISALAGFIILGLGCAPIYPAIVHSTPDNFGRKYSRSIIGVQMAFAYIGFTFSPYTFGRIAESISIKLLPVMIMGIAAVVLLLTERVNRTVAKSHTV